MNAPLKKFAINLRRSLATAFPGYFQTDTKHDHYGDYGFPAALAFDHFYTMYKRNGLGKAAICLTVDKCWQSAPWLLQSTPDEQVHEETPAEAEVAAQLERLQFWAMLRKADEYARVGKYAGVILRVRDGKPLSEPLEKVSGGLASLAELIPVFEPQLSVHSWNTTETSEDYGRPLMYQFNESAITGQTNATAGRQVRVHPSRVHIWSGDGTLHGSPVLEPGYNDLLTLEKIIGAGGEGFWKNAKSAPVLNIDAGVTRAQMADALGVAEEEIADHMDEAIRRWQEGFDANLMLQGIKAETLGVTLPSPEHFFLTTLQCFAAGIGVPLKILVGSQTGERASSEDAKEWAEKCMSRRSNEVIPNIRRLLNRLVEFGLMDAAQWDIDWADLTSATMDQKIDRAVKMADVNQKMMGRGVVYTENEIREMTDHEAIDPADLDDDTPDDDPAENDGLPGGE